MNDYNQNLQPKKPEQQKKPQQPKKPISGDDAKKERINRLIYITAVALLLAVVIIAAVVSATNRAKKPPVETPETNETPNETLPKPQETPKETEPESKPQESEPKPDTDVSSKLPTFASPVKGTLSVKHDPDMQVMSPTMGDYRVHLGVDINTDEKAAVNAAADGKVLKIWEDVKMGWCVAVSHNGEAVTYYKNLDSTLAEGIKEGATVKAGQLLGAVGESAMVEIAQEPHLHFEMTVGGIQVDPMEYLDDGAVATLKQDTNYEG